MKFILHFLLKPPHQHQHRYQQNRSIFDSAASIKWVRDRALDHAVEKERNLKPMLNLKNLIKSEPSKSLPLSLIVQNKQALEIPIRPIDFIRKYPSVFEEFLPGRIGINPHVKLTPQVLDMDIEEQLVYQSENHKQEVADRLLKLLMIVASSAFIESSFIIKKKGLQRAGASGSRAGSGGYGYLLEPLWWVGMITMIVGEFANFVAYIYAPAVLVTPLGALSIIVSAVLAHFLLKEKLRTVGILGCVLCVIGSTIIVLHAPGEHSISSVEEIWALATQPAFLLYTASAIAVVLVLVLFCEPRYGQTNMMIYIGVCSINGSLTVMSVKAIGIAIKLTLEGSSQVARFQTWVFVIVAISCIITQLNYLNKALDTFNTSVVSPIYYAMFTSFTILASAIMFKDWSGQSASNIISVLCGFITVLSGTAVLHSTRDPDPPPSDLYASLSPQISWLVHANGEIWKRKDNDELQFLGLIRPDYFK